MLQSIHNKLALDNFPHISLQNERIHIFIVVMNKSLSLFFIAYP